MSNSIVRTPNAVIASRSKRNIDSIVVPCGKSPGFERLKNHNAILHCRCVDLQIGSGPAHDNEDGYFSHDISIQLLSRVQTISCIFLADSDTWRVSAMLLHSVGLTIKG